MWKALQEGWIPPDSIDEEEYKYIKDEMLPNELRGFAGFGASFAGMFFGTYARDGTTRNYASNAKNGLLKKMLSLSLMLSLKINPIKLFLTLKTL